ncbi:MAG: hypothetical protein IJS22_03400 [Lachnospiraceae bacterium]|nr:hypothetical protein [Lachnospiraceae bacterium]
MKRPDWDKIKAEYISGMSCRKLADKYQVPVGTLQKRIRREHWTELRMQKGAKVDAKIVASVADKQAERAIKLSDTAAALLEQIALEAAQGTYKDSGSIKQITAALKDLQQIMGIKTEEKEQTITIQWDVPELQEYAK